MEGYRREFADRFKKAHRIQRTDLCRITVEADLVAISQASLGDDRRAGAHIDAAMRRERLAETATNAEVGHRRAHGARGGGGGR